jgi:hypothetical protein
MFIWCRPGRRWTSLMTATRRRWWSPARRDMRISPGLSNIFVDFSSIASVGNHVQDQHQSEKLDPDPSFHFDADPAFTLMKIWIRLPKMMWIRIRNNDPLCLFFTGPEICIRFIDLIVIFSFVFLLFTVWMVRVLYVSASEVWYSCSQI